MSQPGDGHPAIRTTGLTKKYATVLAVDRLDLTVQPGEVFGFLGPNGAGKSTTIRMLLGLAKPTAGTAEIFGIPAEDVEAAHRHVAYVPADVALWPNLTGAETLELLANLGPGCDRGYRSELVERFELPLDRRARAYSTGNRQKVAIVAAFATRAPLLVLDEPASGLDPLMGRQFERCVAEAAARGQTVFLSSHQLDEVEKVCTRVGILRTGRLAEVAGLADLRRLRRTEVDITLDEGEVLPELDRLPGLGSLTSPAPNRLIVTLAGSPNALLQVLSTVSVARLDVREPSLEEIFLEYYGSEDAAPRRRPTVPEPR